MGTNNKIDRERKKRNTNPFAIIPIKRNFLLELSGESKQR
jgi:hypothetical protein